MKLIVSVLLVSVFSVQAGEDWRLFNDWAKTKAYESCWGEENMKIHTLKTKKAVAKCLQVDAPELDLPPFRAMDRLVNTLVSSADENQEMMKLMKMMMMMKMMHKHMDSGYGHSSRHNCHGYHDCMEKYGDNKYGDNGMDMMDKFKMKMMMRKMMGDDDSMESYEKDDDSMENMFAKMYKMKTMSSEPWGKNSMMRKMFGGMSYTKRDADDALALNDRLKEKLEGVMEEHLHKISNMTCVLREMNMIDSSNNIDVDAMKKDTENYEMPSEWFKEKYFTILDSCYQVAENLPADLDSMYNVPGQDSALKNVGKIKMFMNCCKSAKMKLCMNQDTKKKIETNFGPVEELLKDFNNQLSEEQLFYMVNQLLKGSEDEFM